MILQEGKYYRARSGVIYGPLEYDHDISDQPFSCQKTRESWTEKGNYWSDGGESQYDLLWDISVVVIDPFQDVINHGAPPKVDRVEIASRILPRLTPNLAPTSAARQALQYADAFIKEIGND
tara:strand:+ start:210 stop:575 length:366 start_codon:yes stop_codon:yes gene_type:complete